MHILDVGPVWIIAPTACHRTGPMPAQSRSPWVLGTRGRPGAGRLNGSNGPTKLVHFITKRIFLMLDPFGYSPLRLAPGRDLYQPNLGPPWVLGTRRSSWGRPSEWVKWTNEIGAFHHKTDILDVGPVWIFAPTACPRTGPIPAQSKSPWVLGTRRSSWGRPV